ncbi:MAG: hypothetical protein H6731_00955 [Myxococcales bacterium]|nr:MAG: hypothetical protein H6731_00955 [Myxococcales bacterium]
MRIALLLVKSIFQKLKSVSQYGLSWFFSSFLLYHSASLERSHFYVVLDEDARLRTDAWRNKEALSISLFPCWQEEWQTGLCYQVSRLEILSSVVEAIGKLAIPGTWIYLFKPSLLPCTYDEKCALGDINWQFKRERLFGGIMKEIKRIGVLYGVNIILIDDRDSIGRKNSALVERLFL